MSLNFRWPYCLMFSENHFNNICSSKIKGHFSFVFIRLLAQYHGELKSSKFKTVFYLPATPNWLLFLDLISLAGSHYRVVAVFCFYRLFMMKISFGLINLIRQWQICQIKVFTIGGWYPMDSIYIATFRALSNGPDEFSSDESFSEWII